MEKKHDFDYEAYRPQAFPSRKRAKESKEPPPPGLDEQRHAAAQQAARQAEALRRGFIASCMAEAMGLNNTISVAGYQAHLDRLIKEAGDPKDPIEVMMIEQLVLAHFRIAALQVDAAQAKSTEATKILTAAAARLLGEFRRTALGLRVYQDRAPGDNGAGDTKVLKMAQ